MAKQVGGDYATTCSNYAISSLPEMLPHNYDLGFRTKVVQTRSRKTKDKAAALTICQNLAQTVGAAVCSKRPAQISSQASSWTRFARPINVAGTCQAETRQFTTSVTLQQEHDFYSLSLNI